MKWPFFFKRKSDDRDEEARIERYKAFRKAGVQLNTALAKQVPKPAVPEFGKKLGLLKTGTLILNNDDEIAILYDYCLHHYRRAGKNTIERYLEQSPPPPDSTEAELLRAMLASRYSLFRVLEILPHRGATLQDLVRGDTLALMDITLSETGMPGIILAGRILPLADFNMSSGTLVPVSEWVFEDKLKPVIHKFFHDPQATPAPAQQASFAAEVLRIALREGGEDNSFYTDIEH